MINWVTAYDLYHGKICHNEFNCDFTCANCPYEIAEIIDQIVDQLNKQFKKS